MINPSPYTIAFIGASCRQTNLWSSTARSVPSFTSWIWSREQQGRHSTLMTAQYEMLLSIDALIYHQTARVCILLPSITGTEALSFEDIGQLILRIFKWFYLQIGAKLVSTRVRFLLHFFLMKLKLSSLSAFTRADQHLTQQTNTGGLVTILGQSCLMASPFHTQTHTHTNTHTTTTHTHTHSHTHTPHTHAHTHTRTHTHIHTHSHAQHKNLPPSMLDFTQVLYLRSSSFAMRR